MERPIFKPVGTPVLNLDTPALVVDLDTLEANMKRTHAFFHDRDVKLRPLVSVHRCPTLAHLERTAGPAQRGIGVRSVETAEVFARCGFTDILITSQIVSPRKAARLCVLARSARITVAADHPESVRLLSTAAAEAGVTIGVVVEIEIGRELCGVQPGGAAVELASSIQAAAGLRFEGLLGWAPFEAGDETSPHEPAKAAERLRAAAGKVLETKELIEKAGLTVRTVCIADPFDHEVAGAVPGITEVLDGAYLLADCRTESFRPGFRAAAQVLTTVTGRPEPSIIVTDCGQKSIGVDYGPPRAEGLHGVKSVRMSAEHGVIEISEESTSPSHLRIGDTVRLTPRDIGTAVNSFDYLHAVRNGRLEAVWDIAARGRYR